MEWAPGAPRPLTDEQRQAWDGRVSRAEAIRKLYEPQWERALKRYAEPLQKESSSDVNPLIDFRHVESKKAQLFYQTPEIQLHPIDPANPEIPVDVLLPLRQRVLNDRLGPDGTDVKRTVHQALFEALASAGILPTEIGYDVRTVKTDTLDPLTGEPQTVDVPVWGMAFWSPFSPKKLLIPDDFRSSHYDKAPWLGVKGAMPLSIAKRELKLPEDFTGTVDRDEAVFDHGHEGTKGDPLVEYVKIWYRAEHFDETIVNPELYRLLVLVKGMEQPARHIDSPFQSIDEMGQLTDDSMRGNPIHLGTLRDLSDAAFIPSDLVVGEPLAKELSKFRTGLIKNRHARTPITFIDPQGLPKATIDKIEAGEKVAFTEPGALAAAGANGLIAVAAVGTEPRDNYASQDYLERDWQGALGTNQNSAGQVDTKKKTTATESRIVAGAASARAEAEKDRLREWFIAGVRKFDVVLQRTMDERTLVKLLGSQGAAFYEQWKMLPGCYTYKIMPDSGVHVDAQQYRAQKLDEYNLIGRDPLFNQVEVRKQLARALGHDPAKSVLEEAPEQGPEPIKTSFAFKGEDLIGPQSQAVVEILAQMGIAISETAIGTLKAAQEAQALLIATGQLGPDGKPAQPVGNAKAKHGGAALQQEKVNQHASEKTGGVQGVGVQ